MNPNIGDAMREATMTRQAAIESRDNRDYRVGAYMQNEAIMHTMYALMLMVEELISSDGRLRVMKT